MMYIGRLSNKIIYFWNIWFLLCFIPIQVADFSVNNLFIFTPFVFLLRGGSLIKLKNIFSMLFIVATITLVIAAIYQFDFHSLFHRRLFSYFLFFSIFSLLVIPFTKKMIYSFLVSFVIVSIGLICNQVYLTITSGILDPGTLKQLVGSQRVGFLHIFSLWITISWIKPSNKLSHNFILLCVVGLIILGLVLTFSRASYVALSAGFILWLFRIFFINGLTKNTFRIIMFTSLFIIFLFFSIQFLLPDFYDFLDERLFSLFADEELSYKLSDSGSSEGARAAIWNLIFEFVLHNPLTGSGFLGSFILSNWSGSAHNEFIDRLLRLGLVGFFIYIFLIYRLLKYLLKEHSYFAYAFFSILAYSMFHETFSQPQGALILSFLLMLFNNHKSNLYENINI